MTHRLGIATDMCYTILESPEAEQASNMQNRRFFIFVPRPQLESLMFQTFDFRCVQTLATAAPGYRGGVYVINVKYWRKLRSVGPPFSRNYCMYRCWQMKQDWGNMNGSGITTG